MRKESAMEEAIKDRVDQELRLVKADAWSEGFRAGEEYRRRLERVSAMRIYGPPDLPKPPANPYQE